MEETVLCCCFTRQELNIIDNQNINHLIIILEVCFILRFSRFYEILNEFFRRLIKYNLIRKRSFYLQTNCLSQVRFSNTISAINKQWVKSGCSRSFCNRFCNCAGKLVAFAFYKIIKRLICFQIRINIDFLDSWDYKRIDIIFLNNRSRFLNFWSLSRNSFYVHRNWFFFSCRFVFHDRIPQLHTFTDIFFERSRQ